MKIYISGQITGLENFAQIFKQAETDLLLEGHEIINPVELNHDHDKSWESYMKEDIKAMCDCDAIYLLKNWIYSRGAKIEKQIAEYLGMQIIYQ